MKWIEVVVRTTEEASDAVSEMLTGIGAGGVVIEDPNDIRKQIESPNTLDYADDEFIQSLGEDVIVKAYFHDSVNNNELLALIREKLEFISQFLDVGSGLEGYSDVDEQDWSTAWKKYYKPFNISDSIVIKPSWEEYSAKPGEMIIELDPGMAFGTGTHETTTMCARMLEKYVKAGDEILDVGCGTGILGIAAVKLGAGHVEAVDVDEVAVRVTRENCEINNVQDSISAHKGAMDSIKPCKADIVVANIIADVIAGLVDTVPLYMKESGIFIASGIIKERRDQIVDAYTAKGLKLVDSSELGEWVALVFKCQDSL